jgi:Protein of unknown function (DUF2490)
MPSTYFRAAVVIAVLGFPAAAQDRQIEQDFRVWFAYSGDHPFGDSRWGVHLEGQIRRQDGLAKWHQFLLRPALNYQTNKLLMLSAGYAYVRSYPRNPSAPRNEHRIWEQARLSYRTGDVAWSSRYRFENRFIEEANGQHRFENRIRALQQASLPLSKRLYITGYDEIYIWVKPYQASSWFDQNRAYAGLGFNLKPGWRYETGYMNQVLLLRSGRVLEVNHILVFSLLSTAPFR